MKLFTLRRDLKLTLTWIDFSLSKSDSLLSKSENFTPTKLAHPIVLQWTFTPKNLECNQLQLIDIGRI